MPIFDKAVEKIGVMFMMAMMAEFKSHHGNAIVLCCEKAPNGNFSRLVVLQVIEY